MLLVLNFFLKKYIYSLNLFLSLCLLQFMNTPSHDWWWVYFYFIWQTMFFEAASAGTSFVPRTVIPVVAWNKVAIRKWMKIVDRPTHVFALQVSSKLNIFVRLGRF